MASSIFFSTNAASQEKESSGMIKMLKEISNGNYAAKKTGTPLKGGCEDCLHGANLPPELSTLPIGKGRFNKRCQKFINEKGGYGSWGQMIIDYLGKNKETKNRFFSNAILGMESSPRTCPMWGKLNDNQKAKFWVWTMASIAQVESSCDPRSVNNGPTIPDKTDPPRGLFQLNTKKSNRSWRGPNCKFPTGAEHVYDPKNNITCSMDIMSELLKGKSGEYKSNGRIFPTNSYWEKLRSKKHVADL